MHPDMLHGNKSNYYQEEEVITKRYNFTKIEMETIRNALIEYHQKFKILKPLSPHVLHVFKAVEALKNQFKDDVIMEK